MEKNRWKKWILYLCALGCTGLCLLFGLSFYVKYHTGKRILTIDEAASFDADCILVLGCGVRPDGSPSHMLEDRILTGMELYENGASNRLLMSGDHSRADYDEVNLMKNFAIAKGGKSEEIFMDHAGFSTYESVYRTKDIFQAKKIMIVSQAYHLPRALYIAERMGLDAYGVSADKRPYRGKIYREFREVVARGKDFVFAWIQPAPTYLGEAIPVSGNGDITNDQKK